MQEKILVIGSNSFSGSHFINFALQKGSVVFGISRSEEPNDVFLPFKWLPQAADKFSFFNYDLNHHLDKIMELINVEKPAYIVNFAAQSMVAQSWEHPEHWFQTNLVSTVKFHNQLRLCNFIKKYVHVTTPEVYGSTHEFIKEDAAFLPSTPYAVSRAACDMSLRTFFEAYKFPVVFTRAANVYGPGQQLYRIIPRTILYFRLGKPIELHGGGISRRSFIYIDDVSSATWSVMLDGKIGDTYHISTNYIVSIKELVQKIAKEMNVDFNKLVNVTEERLGKDSAYLLDSHKIRKELNWHDKVSLDEGIKKCIHWVDKNLKILKDLPFDYQHKL